MAGPFRSILVGRSGSDTLTGTLNDDLLIGGTTSYDASSVANDTAWQALLSEWTRIDLGCSYAAYLTRIKHLRGTVGGGLHGGSFLNAATVTDDGAADVLKGGSGFDWFWANLAQDSLPNRVTGGATPEIVN